MLREETIRGALTFLLTHELNRLQEASSLSTKENYSRRKRREYIRKLMREMGWEETKPVPPPSESGTESTCESTGRENGDGDGKDR